MRRGESRAKAGRAHNREAHWQQIGTTNITVTSATTPPMQARPASLHSVSVGGRHKKGAGGFRPPPAEMKATMRRTGGRQSCAKHHNWPPTTEGLLCASLHEFCHAVPVVICRAPFPCASSFYTLHLATVETTEDIMACRMGTVQTRGCRVQHRAEVEHRYAAELHHAWQGTRQHGTQCRAACLLTGCGGHWRAAVGHARRPPCR